MNLAFWKKETVGKAEHEQALAEWRKVYTEQFKEAARLRTELGQERETVARIVKRKREIAESLSAASLELHSTKADLTAARAEAEANKVDADKYRRSRANLKQFRKEKEA